MDSIHPLRAYRERQSPPLTQEQLAAQLNVSKASVSRWETGERKPEVELLPGVARKTGIPAAELRPDLAEMFARPRRSKAARTRSRAA